MNFVLGCLAGVLKPIALLFPKCKMGFAAEMLAKQEAIMYAGGLEQSKQEAYRGLTMMTT